jgi:manganese transport protein
MAFDAMANLETLLFYIYRGMVQGLKSWRIDVNLIVCAAHHPPVRAEESPLQLSRHQVAGDSAKGNAGLPAAEEPLTPSGLIKYSLDEEFTIVNRKMGDILSKQLATQPPLDTEGTSGWRQALTLPSLPEAHRTIQITQGSSWFRKILAFAGPGYLIAVGYMDPGNWATDIGGGSKFGYALLSVVLISNLMAMFLQGLSAKLGIATGRDLAQACRDHYSRRVSIFLWVVCELAIAACDLAEVLGSAIALKLLFGLPLLAGVVLTAFDVLVVLALQGRGFRLVEAFVVTLIGTIAACFAYELFFARPLWLEAAHGFVPHLEIFRNKEMLYIAIGIIGATVMPHNLYLHSSIVQTRAFGPSDPERREAIKYAIIDSTVALTFALFINAAILVLGAAAFHTRGLHEVADISQAYKLLSPVLGASLGSTLFAFALLASGQNSTLTGTLAGQIVMEGFLQIRLKPWIRRLITRLIAILPAVLVIGIAGEGKLTALLILSQVVLSFQLPFAVIPLVRFTSERSKMGEFVNSRLTTVIAWGVTAAILFFNAELLWLTFRFY